MIRIYYHLWMNNEWYDIFQSQIMLLIKSNLYNVMDSMHVSVIGDVELFKKCIKDYEKIKIVLANDNPKIYEFGILQVLHEDSKKLDAKILYFHAKGTSYLKDHKHFGNQQDWRKYMEYFLIENYQLCLKALETHDICGVSWLTQKLWVRYPETCYPPHFSGNFWWANSSYIRKLKKPEPGPEWKRRDAEFWIGTGKPRVKNLFASGVNHYINSFKRERYVK